MVDKVALVTGGTSGIGFETARGLAALGYDVTIVGRDPARCESALEEIRTASPGHLGSVIRADLASMKEVRRIASEFARAHKRLDVLVNNAAVWLDKRRVTSEGFEATFATNHLAPFLLTDLLLPLLRKSAPSRIVNLTSGLHM